MLKINPVIRAARRCLLEHPLVRPDKVPRRLAKNGAPAILHGAPEVFVAPCPAPRRIVRRADHVRKVEKRVTHREVAMPHRLHPPRVNAGEKVRMRDEMRVERSLIDYFAARDVDQDVG
jgi:hypothetical protein